MSLRFLVAAMMMTSVSVFAEAEDVLLTKEIVIEREIDPSIRAVSRLGGFPSIMQPTVATPSLMFSDVTTSVSVPSIMTRLDPARPGSMIGVSPYRGYAAIGYFPAFNMGASAGYRFVQTSRTSAGMNLQYDGFSYKDRAKETLRRNTVTVSGDVAHSFDNGGELQVDATYTYNNLNLPWIEGNPSEGWNRFNLNGGWMKQGDNKSWFIGGGYEYFSVGDLGQNVVDLRGGATYGISERSSITGVVGADFVASGGMPTMTALTIAPAYNYKAEGMSAKLGVKAQAMFNAGRAFNVSPDVELTLRGGKFFTLTLNAGGGEELNRLSRLLEVNPYAAIGGEYGFSHVPLTFGAEALVGPWHGAWLQAFGGYALADDWLMPYAASPDRVGFKGEDMRSWQYGIALGWRYRDVVEAKVRLTETPGEGVHAWYLNGDRARHVVEASVEVSPMERLTVDVRFALRAGRQMESAWGEMGLKNVNSLDFGGKYAFTDRFSVFGRVENVLNNRGALLCLRECQGVKGLLGVAVKF